MQTALHGDGARSGRRTTGGATLLELLVALSLLSLVAAVSVTAYRRWRDATALEAAVRAAHGQLALARSRAVAARARLRVRLGAGDVLETVREDGTILDRTYLSARPLRIDSASLHPPTLSFNARGQAAPGSLYLYRGRHVVRIVSNFLGRLRIVRSRLSGG